VSSLSLAIALHLALLTRTGVLENAPQQEVEAKVKRCIGVTGVEEIEILVGFTGSRSIPSKIAEPYWLQLWLSKHTVYMFKIDFVEQPHRL